MVPHSHLTQSKVSNKKVLLARAMAAEAITVVRDPRCTTAYFDIKNRVLGLPPWQDMSDDLETMLLAHEIGHALDTPLVDFSEISKGKGKAHSHAVDIIEDFRIDRRQKRRYPGLASNYRIGTKEMLETGIMTNPSPDRFFTPDGEIDPTSFLNRLFTYTKITPYTNDKVPFTSEELQLVYGVEECDSFDHVIESADEIHAYVRKYLPKKKKRKKEKSPEGIESDETEIGDRDRNPDAPKKEREDLDGEEKLEDETPDEDLDAGGSDLFEDLLDKLSDLTGQDLDNGRMIGGKPPAVNITDLTFNSTNLDAVPYVYHYTDAIYDLFQKFHQKVSAEDKIIIDKELKGFLVRTSKIVHHMVQEFMMRKAAREYSRTRVSKTGVLCSKSLHRYRFSDDVFKKTEMKRKGKSHGVLFFLDMSGSMQNFFHESILQLFNLVMFCRSLKMPFEVYGFTSNGPISGWIKPEDDSFAQHRLDPKTWDDKYSIVRSLTLNNYFSSKMNQSEVFFAMKSMIAYSMVLKSRRNSAQIRAGLHQLSGTPLDPCLLISKDLFWIFKKHHKLDVVHSVFISDGCNASGLIEKSFGEPNNFRIQNGPLSYVYNGETSTILEILRDETGSKIVSFFLCRSTSDMGCCQEFSRLKDEDKKKAKGDFENDGYAEIDSCYDQLFIVNPTLLGLLDEADLRMQLKARPLLQSFIRTISA